MTYTETVTTYRRRAAALYLISCTGTGGGMWTISAALAGTQGHGPVPLEALPFGILAFGMGSLLAVPAGRALFARTITRTYEGTTP